MKSAPPRKETRSHCLFPMARVATYGIIKVHPVSHLFPMHGCKGSVWLWRHRQGRAAEPFRAESSSNGFERIPPENLATANHTLERHPATETSDWREIRRKRRNGLQTKLNIDASSVSRSFFFCRSSIAAASMGRRQTALLQENQVAVSL